MSIWRNGARLKKIMDMGRKQKMQVAAIVVMMIIGAFLETLGVSMVVPLVLIVTQPGAMENDPVIKTLCSIGGIHTERTLVLTVIAGLAAVFIIKGFFSLQNIRYNLSLYMTIN